MLEKRVDAPPLFAPKVFQYEYLEKVEAIKRVEKQLDNEGLRAKAERELAEKFYDKGEFDIQDLRNIQDLDPYDQERIIAQFQEKVERKIRKLSLFQNQTSATPVTLSQVELKQLSTNRYIQ